MISLKKRQGGFTIVELLIVIVVIGILATLVIVTFTGIQKKARDNQRQTDINAVNSQLAAFYTEHGYYPTAQDLKTGTFLSANMKGLDPESLVDPKQDSSKGDTISGTAVPATTYQYSYVATASVVGATCDNATASDPTTNSGCDTYTLTAHLENGPDFIKKSN